MVRSILESSQFQSFQSFHRRASASVCCLHRLEHGSGYRTPKPVPVVPNVQPLRSVQNVSGILKMSKGSNNSREGNKGDRLLFPVAVEGGCVIDPAMPR